MRSQRRPFTVETKRTRRYWVQPSPTPTASISLSSDDEPTPRFLGVIPPEGLVPEAGREEALALAAQVFGESVAAAPDPSDAMLADAPVLAEPLPDSRKPRVLPDLLATAREQSEAEKAEKRPRITRRSKSNAVGQGTMPVDRQTAFRFEEPDQPDDTAPERDAERAGAARRAPADAEPRTDLPSKIASAPIYPAFAMASLGSRNGKATKWFLPRSERWKERRLPRVCWDKSRR
jgi:hypothetical protein